MAKYIRLIFEKGHSTTPHGWFQDTPANRQNLQSGINAHANIGIKLTIAEMETDEKVHICYWPKDD